MAAPNQHDPGTRGPSRRALLAGTVTGAAGLAIGAGRSPAALISALSGKGNADGKNIVFQGFDLVDVRHQGIVVIDGIGQGAGENGVVALGQIDVAHLIELARVGQQGEAR